MNRIRVFSVFYVGAFVIQFNQLFQRQTKSKRNCKMFFKIVLFFRIFGFDCMRWLLRVSNMRIFDPISHHVFGYVERNGFILDNNDDFPPCSRHIEPDEQCFATCTPIANLTNKMTATNDKRKQSG